MQPTTAPMRDEDDELVGVVDFVVVVVGNAVHHARSIARWTQTRFVASSASPPISACALAAVHRSVAKT